MVILVEGQAATVGLVGLSCSVTREIDSKLAGERHMEPELEGDARESSSGQADPTNDRFTTGNGDPKGTS